MVFVLCYKNLAQNKHHSGGQVMLTLAYEMKITFLFNMMSSIKEINIKIKVGNVLKR
jgi:hypothetical protein